MTDQTIQNKQAFVVVDSNTMERISKFYSRVSDAKTYGTVYNRYKLPKRNLAIAVFEFKEMYKMEESV